MQAVSEDEFGVNDKYFNFKRYQFEGVELDDIERPTLMQELFPEKFPRSQQPKAFSQLPKVYSEDEDDIEKGLAHMAEES